MAAAPLGGARRRRPPAERFGWRLCIVLIALVAAVGLVTLRAAALPQGRPPQGRGPERPDVAGPPPEAGAGQAGLRAAVAELRERVEHLEAANAELAAEVAAARGGQAAGDASAAEADSEGSEGGEAQEAARAADGSTSGESAEGSAAGDSGDSAESAQGGEAAERVSAQEQVSPGAPALPLTVQAGRAAGGGAVAHPVSSGGGAGSAPGEGGPRPRPRQRVHATFSITTRSGLAVRPGDAAIVHSVYENGQAKLWVLPTRGQKGFYVDRVRPWQIGMAPPPLQKGRAVAPADVPDGDDDGRVGDWPPRKPDRGGVRNSAAIAAEILRRGEFRGVRLPEGADAAGLDDPFRASTCNVTEVPYRNRGALACPVGSFLNHTEICGHPPVMLLIRKRKKRISHRRVSFGRSLFYGPFHPYLSIVDRYFYLDGLHNASRDLPGMAVSALEGTGVAESVSELPVVDTHGGVHDIFRPWPIGGNHSQGEVARWRVHFWRSYESARREKAEPQSFARQREVFAAGVPNVWVKDGNVYSCKWGFSPGGCEWEFEAEDQARWVLKKAVVVCNSECNGYFHFTHDHLPRIALLYNEIMADPDMNVLLPSMSPHKAPFIAQYLHEILGIPYYKLVSADAKTRHWPRTWSTVFVRWAVLPQPTMCGKLLTYPLFLLRKLVFERLGLQHEKSRNRSGPFRVLFAERRSSRMALNWEEMRESLEREFNGTVVFDGGLDRRVIEQVAAFNAADMVIGPHGANLANIMWMRHGTTVLEMASINYGNMCYYSTSSRLGLLHRFVLHEGGKGGNYSVDISEVSRHIRDAVRRDAGQEPLVFH